MVSVMTEPPSERAQLDPHDGHDGDRGIPQGVLPHHRGPAHALTDTLTTRFIAHAEEWIGGGAVGVGAGARSPTTTRSKVAAQQARSASTSSTTNDHFRHVPRQDRPRSTTEPARRRRRSCCRRRRCSTADHWRDVPARQHAARPAGTRAVLRTPMLDRRDSSRAAGSGDSQTCRHRRSASRRRAPPRRRRYRGLQSTILACAPTRSTRPFISGTSWIGSLRAQLATGSTTRTVDRLHDRARLRGFDVAARCARADLGLAPRSSAHEVTSSSSNTRCSVAARPRSGQTAGRIHQLPARKRRSLRITAVALGVGRAAVIARALAGSPALVACGVACQQPHACNSRPPARLVRSGRRRRYVAPGPPQAAASSSSISGPAGAPSASARSTQVQRLAAAFAESKASIVVGVNAGEEAADLPPPTPASSASTLS